MSAEVVTFDAFDPVHRHDPYPRYAAVRDAAATHPLPIGLHLVTRYADCAQALSDPAWSHADEGPMLHPEVDEVDLPASFLWMDPPDHTRLRGLVSGAFTGRRVAGLRPRIEQIADDLLDDAVGAGDVEAVERIAYPLPLTVICELIGIPPGDHALVHRTAPALARGFDPDVLLTPAERAARTDAARELITYFTGLIAERLARPTGDLLSDLGAIQVAGDRLTADELLATCVTLLVAGHETAVNLVGNGLLALLRHPEQFARLRADRELARPAVDEVLRHDPPVHLTTRVARAPLELGGRRFAAGEGVVVLIGSGNRDPRAFIDPDRFDPSRYAGPTPARRHLTFGLGLHYCLGAPLARLEMQLLLERLAERVGRLEPGGDGPSYKPNIVLRGLERLPLRLEHP